MVDINGIDYTFTPSASYSLQNDIDLSTICSEEENKSWLPIGRYATTCFSGIFLGNSHEIRNIYINTLTDASPGEGTGFFGVISDYAIINGLTISGTVINNSKNTDAGGIVGSSTFYSNTSISNCCNKANITNTYESYSAGGILGGRSV